MLWIFPESRISILEGVAKPSSFMAASGTSIAMHDVP
jgi:hypothetical protein